MSSDGCSATCQVEAGAVCSGTAPTTCSKLVINEVDYDQPGTDNTGGLFEFVEIYNAGTAPADVTNVALVLMNGGTLPAVEYSADGVTPFVATKRILLNTAAVPSNLLPPGGFIVVAPAGQFTAPTFPASAFRITIVPNATGWLQNGGTDALGLAELGATPRVIDALSYEGNATSGTILGVGVFSFVEGTGSVPGDAAVVGGLARLPDGRDTQNNSTDFVVRTVTPGLPN